MSTPGGVEHFFRHEYGHLVALLSRRFGVAHIAAIEDAAQSALIKALELWTTSGEPRNPSAWLFSVARNEFLAQMRQGSGRRRILERYPVDLAPVWDDVPDDFVVERMQDDLLRMLFVCCDALIPPESQIVLALKTLCGFGIPEIATRLFASEASIYKRLSRARSILRGLSPSIMDLDEAEYAARVSSVCSVLYALFSEGYLSLKADAAIRRDLCDEALRLTGLLANLGGEFARRDGQGQSGQSVFYGASQLHPYDAELARDAFWDLFRQGMITLGLNDSNPAWPWFRLSHIGRRELAAQSPLRFYDSGTFIALVREQVPDISDEALVYLKEAAGAFYTNLLLSACVMVGVAAEAEFNRLVDTAARHRTHGSRFNAAQKAEFVGSKVDRFRKALEAIRGDLPREVLENLEILTTIQAVIRTARNEAGHPVVTALNRQQVYVFLQLFVPMARQMMQVRQALS